MTIEGIRGENGFVEASERSGDAEVPFFMRVVNDLRTTGAELLQGYVGGDLLERSAQLTFHRAAPREVLTAEDDKQRGCILVSDGLEAGEEDFLGVVELAGVNEVDGSRGWVGA